MCVCGVFFGGCEGVWGEEDEGLRGDKEGGWGSLSIRGVGIHETHCGDRECGEMTRFAVMCSRGVCDRDGVLGGRGFVRGSEIVGDHPWSRQVHHELL